MLSGNYLDTVILPFVTLNCSNNEVSIPSLLRSV